MVDRSDVCVLLPTLNEATTIGSVIEGLHEAGYDRILVMDGGSEDDTREIAEDHGAEVRVQSGSGKGQAVIEAVAGIDERYVLMLDGDGTYRPADADRVVEPVVEGDADHAIGNRFHDMETGAMTRLNRFGNRMINRLFRLINRRELHDILSGYRAFSRDSVQQLDLSAEGFGIEAEMTGSAIRHGQRIEEVPIVYKRRPSASETKLHPVRDGAVILTTLYLIARMNNPLMFFGSIGVLSGAFGVGLGLYVGYRWYFAGVSHNVLAIVSSFFILFGFLLVMFGVLSDMIVRLHEEQRQRIEHIREAVDELE
ncbi:MAG: S-layer glycoprotein N-glycosyltransferase AglJ [Halobacteriales archaeon]